MKLSLSKSHFSALERHNEMKTKSHFTLSMSPKITIVKDLDKGGMSVTNDIENVVKFVAHEYQQTRTKMPRAFIYCDSNGIYDGVEHKNGKFVCIYTIGKLSADEAIDISHQMMEERS